ncbi:MAG: hypothetical protein NTY76_04640 [Candidatus Omnitrophica bacterium]|nr:hypothetical protein [Candidatus Omnitrophota bacterium]
MKKIIVLLAACALLSGCATPGDVWKEFVGASTKGIEQARADAMTKVFDYDYKTCYEKVEAFVKTMPNVSIYSKDKGMIAIYVINPNTTPAGIFFKEIDSTHTQVDVSSESTPTKEWVANSIFSETVLKQEKSDIKF